jgi:hypothetical protein
VIEQDRGGGVGRRRAVGHERRAEAAVEDGDAGRHGDRVGQVADQVAEHQRAGLRADPERAERRP